MDLSLANDSNKRMSKDCTLANESLASLKATHSELQSSLSCLTEKYKTLEANFSSLWESTKATPSARLDSNASTSKGCSTCSNIDINAIKTNHARLEDKIKSKDKEIDRLNMLITQGNIGAKPIPKVVDKQGLGHRKNNKANVRVVVKGHEIPLWNKGGYLNTIMDIAHGVTTSTTTKHMPKVVNTTKGCGGGVGVLDRQTYQGGTRGSSLCGEDRDRETENSKVCARTRDTRFIQVRAAKVASPTSCLGDRVWRPALGVGWDQVPG
jgi:hypothetical protein